MKHKLIHLRHTNTYTNITNTPTPITPPLIEPFTSCEGITCEEGTTLIQEPSLYTFCENNDCSLDDCCIENGSIGEYDNCPLVSPKNSCDNTCLFSSNETPTIFHQYDDNFNNPECLPHNYCFTGDGLCSNTSKIADRNSNEIVN